MQGSQCNRTSADSLNGQPHVVVSVLDPPVTVMDHGRYNDVAGTVSSMALTSHSMMLSDMQDHDYGNASRIAQIKYCGSGSAQRRTIMRHFSGFQNPSRLRPRYGARMSPSLSVV